ncbi:MAG: RNA polymerase sigma factor SigJ [Kofleriaceae bacterium]
MKERFAAHMPRLQRLAYGMLGEVAAAEDVVQESYLRFAKHAAAIDNDGGWLTTTVTRLALDAATSARARREVYVGPWLPEPIAASDPLGPCTQDISFALLVLLESLSPKERAVFVLRELFDVAYADVAAALQLSEPATRQLFHRALESLRARKQRYAIDEAAHARLLAAFVQAAMSGELETMVSLLARDVTSSTDSGGKRSAATRVVVGPANVSKLIAGLVAKGGDSVTPRLVTVNQTPALLLVSAAGVESLLLLVATEEGDRIAQICMVRNPDKLGHVG